MRSFKLTMILCSMMLVLAPTPAHAWFELLDYLSGPGPFRGPKADFRIWCFRGDRTTGELIANAEKLFASAIAKSFTSDNASADWTQVVGQLEQINLSFPVQTVQEGDILAHIVQTASRCAAPFGSQHSRDAMHFQNRLDSTFSQTENLAATIGHQLFWIERKAHFSCVLCDDQSNRQRAFSPKPPFRCKSR